MGSPAVREPVVKTGDIVEGRYRIIRMLGEGGMGSVFLAEHMLIKRRVAIKILHPELATDANVIERFMNEARAAGTLGHPNIVESTDMGFTSNHTPYIVFEYLEGSLLTDEIYRLGGLPVRRAVRIAAQIASAAHAAHNAGVIHRDLKSDNVFLTDKDDAFDHVKVLDFGISRFLMIEDKQKAMVLGTPEFMAPEQITDPEHIDRRADIYALGVILYEMLTARRPFPTEADPQQLLERIVHEPPAPLARADVPLPLVDALFGKLLAKDREQRYATMSDVEAALESFVTRSDGTPVPHRRSQPLPMLLDDEDGDDGDGDGARSSGKIPRPARANTPYPASAAAIAAAKQVGLGPAPARPIVPYAIAAGGVLVGILGLAFGLHRHEKIVEVPAPAAPAAVPHPAAPAPAAPAAKKIVVQLDADLPKARVTFRRHVTEAPVVLTINTSDVVELVEVSAPGYKTARFWLTFDQPLHLRAHLVRGSGLAEATEEETLVALGEAQPAPEIEIDKPAKPVEKAQARKKPPAAVEDPPTPAPEPAPTADEPAPGP